MQIVDEYTGTVHEVPPEEEALVLQMMQQGRTVPEIVEVLSIPTPEAPEAEVVGYFPATDGGVISVDEIPELNEEPEDGEWDP